MSYARTIPNWVAVPILGGFLVLVSLGVHTQAPIEGCILLGILAVLYWLPSVVAWQRQHRQRQAIVALNLLAGWTFVGWVAALVWALTAQPPTNGLVD